jgi:hypothetical protein
VFPSIPTSSSPVSEEEGKLIQEIQQNDNETFNKLGSQLRDLAEQISGITKSPQLFEQQFHLTYKDSKGKFTAQCLFCNKIEENSLHYKITNRQTGISLTVSKIALHYMTHHDFCGFPGIDHRVEPKDLTCVLRPPQSNFLSRIIHFFHLREKE